jgi:hypothetical protein
MKMKRTLLMAFALAFAFITPLHADSALDNFKKEMTALEASIKVQEAALKDNPMGGIAMIRDIIGKLKSIKVDGLPDDLKSGYLEFVATISKMGDVFKEWPAKPEEMQAFIVKKIGEDPKYMDNFGEKMAALEKEMQPATAKLDALGKKYGLDGLGALAPGK